MFGGRATRRIRGLSTGGDDSAKIRGSHWNRRSKHPLEIFLWDARMCREYLPFNWRIMIFVFSVQRFSHVSDICEAAVSRELWTCLRETQCIRYEQSYYRCFFCPGAMFGFRMIIICIQMRTDVASCTRQTGNHFTCLSLQWSFLFLCYATLHIFQLKTNRWNVKTFKWPYKSKWKSRWTAQLKNLQFEITNGQR